MPFATNIEGGQEQRNISQLPLPDTALLFIRSSSWIREMLASTLVVTMKHLALLFDPKVLDRHRPDVLSRSGSASLRDAHGPRVVRETDQLPGFPHLQPNGSLQLPAPPPHRKASAVAAAGCIRVALLRHAQLSHFSLEGCLGSALLPACSSARRTHFLPCPLRQ